MRQYPAPLDWEKIQEEVIAAAKELTESQFINARRLAEHMALNRGTYPVINGVSEWHPEAEVTDRTIMVRVQEAISNMKWKKWSAKTGKTRGKIFILPWASEDPIVAEVRKAEA